MKRPHSKVNFGLLNLVLSASFLVSSAVRAEEAASFFIDHDVLTYYSNEATPDKAGVEPSKQTGLVTTPRDVTIGIFWKEFGLYVTPGVAGGTVGLSYFAKKELEFGLLFGADNTKLESQGAAPNTTATTEQKSTSIGAFGQYYLAISSDSSAEFSLTYLNSSLKRTTENPPAAQTTNNDSKSNLFTFVAQYVVQVAPHFSVIPGLVYMFGNNKDDLGDTKDKVSNLSLNIAHFRYNF